MRSGKEERIAESCEVLITNGGQSAEGNIVSSRACGADSTQPGGGGQR